MIKNDIDLGIVSLCAIIFGIKINKNIQQRVNAMILAISNETITKLGLYGLLPLFIGFLFFIMWDLSKKSNAGRNGTFWIFIALGGGFFGFLAKVVIEFVLEHWILK